ncbi:MAG: hypothetical protein QOE11_161 [Solirubrobacteraceae bacterium]|jgi:hypothetical protein|nr:hypothetical protein [Solirubrobacteraceae bacterium]
MLRVAPRILIPIAAVIGVLALLVQNWLVVVAMVLVIISQVIRLRRGDGGRA